MTTELFNKLIEKARANDNRAVCALHDYCISAIKSHLITRFNNRLEAEDWARDVFTFKIYSNLPTVPIDYPLAWLYKIADNYVITLLEKRKVSVEFNENAYPDEYFEDHLNKFIVDEAFSFIDETTCKILVLNNIYGYTYEEIAAMVNLKPAAVRQRARRVKINRKLLSHFHKN